MRIYALILILVTLIMSKAQAAYEPFEPDVIQLTNTALANANASTVAAEFNNFNTTAVVNTDTDSDVFTSITSNGVVCAPGTYLVDVVMYQTATSARTNVYVEVTLDSVSTGIRGANAYIRNANGHNESSALVADMVQLTSSGKIGFDFARLAAAGTVAVPVGQSSMRITRIKD